MTIHSSEAIAGDRGDLQQDRQKVLGPHQPAVEQAEARQGHQQHERGGNEDPACVAGVARGSGVLSVCRGRRDGGSSGDGQFAKHRSPHRR
jgi:hypothetical protein